MAGESPNLPLKIRFMLAMNAFVASFFRCSDGTINRRLLKVIDYINSTSKPSNGVTSTDIIVDSSRDIWIRIFTPITTTTAAAASVPVVVYFHGGGFVCGAPNSKPFDQFCRAIAKQVAGVVVSVNYRLSPEHRYPCQYEDGFDSLKFIDDNKQLPESADLSNCFIAGDSAGGNIAHHVTLKACKHQFKTLKVKGLIAIQPFFGGEDQTESEKRLNAPVLNVKVTDWCWKAFLPEGEGMNRDHEVVNVCGPRSVDISGYDFPMTLVIVAEFDPLSDRQKWYVDWLKSSGKDVKMIEYPNMFHGFYGFLELPEARLLVEDIREFLHNLTL